jgi:hypothetical protein
VLEVREELLNLAEIAIGIAGFSGVIAAFLQRDGLHPVDRARFINLFATAFSTLVLAYVPIVVSHRVAEPDQIWRISSAAMVVIWLFGSSASYLGVFPIIREHVFTPVAFWLLSIPSMMNLAVQVSNAGGWLWHPGFLAYLFGLFVYLYAAGLMFVYIVLYRPPPSSVDEHTG